jgi:hypothetical protein
MGRELPCNVRYGGQTHAGKALLETSELLFRGDRGGLRLRIDFSKVRHVKAANGLLEVCFGEESAVFELGDPAALWAERMLHPPTRLDKLGLRAGTRWRWLGPPDDDFKREAAAHGAVQVADAAELTFIRAEDRSALDLLAGCEAPLWVVYPRGVKTIREADVLTAGRAVGLADVKVARWSDTHTALKFVNRKN